MKQMILASVVVFAATTAIRAVDPPARPIVFGVPVTHSDWMLRPGTQLGPAGVRHMLDTCKACGWTRIYWRALDGGRSLYKSRLLDPMGKWDQDSFWSPVHPADIKLVDSYGITPAMRAATLPKFAALDYSEFDSLAEAVRYGHQIGLEVHAWITINEDDHGWGLRSRFSQAHPAFRWVKRDGTPFRSQMSFAFSEVMSYKLAIVEEIVTGYDIDGIFLDWIRTGDVRDNPQTDADGVANHGYEKRMVDEFRAKYQRDPLTLPTGDDRWVRHRAEPHSAFMRSIRDLVKKAKQPKIIVSVLVGHPWLYRGTKDKIDGNLRGLLLDVASWSKEGLIDEAVAAGYYLPGGTPETAYEALAAETGNKVPLWLFGWVPTNVAELDRDVTLARKLQARQLLFWEADYIDSRANKEELQIAMRAFAAPQSK